MGDIYARTGADHPSHLCRGLDYIGQWSWPNFQFERIGADTTAKYIAFRCAYGYTESLDMPTALHPQTILATKYAREPITDPFGFPIRLRTSPKLGFKNAKWIVSMEVTNDFPETYYGKEGFNWFSGDLTSLDRLCATDTIEFAERRYTRSSLVIESTAYLDNGAANNSMGVIISRF